MTFALVHDRLRETYYESLPQEVRVRWHGRIAACIERTFAGDLEPHYYDLSRHCTMANRSDAALEYSLLGAGRAKATLAHGTAIEMLERALSLTGAPVNDNKSSPTWPTSTVSSAGKTAPWSCTKRFWLAAKIRSGGAVLARHLDDSFLQGQICSRRSMRSGRASGCSVARRRHTAARPASSSACSARSLPWRSANCVVSLARRTQPSVRSASSWRRLTSA